MVHTFSKAHTIVLVDHSTKWLYTVVVVVRVRDAACSFEAIDFKRCTRKSSNPYLNIIIRWTIGLPLFWGRRPSCWSSGSSPPSSGTRYFIIALGLLGKSTYSTMKKKNARLGGSREQRLVTLHCVLKGNHSDRSGKRQTRYRSMQWETSKADKIEL